jgi:hypothetical protein
MNDLLAKTDEILKNHQAPRRPSQFQILHLLINKEPTNQGRLWRAVEEMRSKKMEIDSANEQIKDYEDQIKIMVIDERDIMIDGGMSNQQDAIIKCECQKRMAQRRIESTKKQIEEIKYIIESRKQEIEILLDIYQQLSTKEGIQSWDDPKAQLQYWEAKLGNEIALRTAAGMPQDLEVLRSAMSLPGESRLKQLIRESINRKMLPEGQNESTT